ncbi:MAG: tetratricopeptide repeat protein, partial [Sphingobacteriaceae bacterium]
MKVKVILIAALTLISLRGFAQLTLERGYELVQQGKIPESIAVFEQIAVKQPRNSEVYNALSQLYYRQSKYKQAYDAADKGLAISVKDDNLSISKAKAANNLGKFDEAIALMDACIARDAAFFLPYAVKANAYDGQNKLQLAIGLYSKSIQLDPEYARNYLDRGSDFASLSRYDQAIA